MSMPTLSPKRDPILTAFVTEFKGPEFVGDTIFPIFESKTRTVQYAQMDKLNLFQSVDDTLARDGEANEVGYGASKASEIMRNFALRATVTREDVEDAEDWDDVSMNSADTLRQTLALRREMRQAGLLFSALDGASRSEDPGNWADYGAGAVDVLTQVRGKANDALYPYTHLVMPKQVKVVLERHPKLLAEYFSGTSGQKLLSLDNLKELFGVPNIVVPDGRMSTQRRPTAITGSLDNLSRIWGNHLFMIRVPTALPSRTAPACTYQFRRRWSKTVGDNMQVRTWEEPKKGIGGAYVIQQEYQALDKVFPEMGYVFKNVLA